MSAPILHRAPPFAVATLAPIPLLALGGLVGGVWILLALLYMTALRMALDRLVAAAGPEGAPGSEFPAAERLSRALALAHFPLLALGVAGLAGATGLGVGERLGVFLAFGLWFGQVSNANAHELIHRADRRLFALGKWVLISLLYGHHVSAHLRVHHRFVATPGDPNSAPLGQGFWQFAPRAWGGSFVAGWRAERALAGAAARPLPFWRHPYAEYVAGAAGVLVLSALLFGAAGPVAHLALAAYAQLQLLVSDYVQHYGLTRRTLGPGHYEPVAARHSWNAPHWFSGGLLLNGPRHSDHHAHPARLFPELVLPAADEGPRLPRSLPVMGAIALVPPLWHRLMDRRAARWQQEDAAGPEGGALPPPVEAEAEAVDAAPAGEAGAEETPADLLRRIEAAEAAQATAAEAPAPAQRSDGRAKTPDLWASQPGAGGAAEVAAPAPAAPGSEAAVFRSARSAELFQPAAEGASAPAPPETKEARQDMSGDSDRPEDEGPGAEPPALPADDGVAEAVARLFAAQPKPPPRAAMLPPIEGEQAGEAAEPHRPGLLAAAARAARALAALLRGAPPRRKPREEEET